MEKNKLIEGLLKKSQDYSQQIYLLGFFFVFILMIIFMVRPQVNEYIVRNKQLQETVLLSSQYQKAISNLTELQGLLETKREDFTLLDQAIPENVQMYQLTQDIKDSFLKYVSTRTYTFPSYLITPPKAETKVSKIGTLQTYKILVNVSGSYATTREILQKILNQRRIKSVKTLLLSRPEGSSDSAELEMRLEVEAYYL
ncbi:hypothetical protein KBB12_01575 [Candidatus Woesebacteria bacterium]|nr:hypothetical protein [Candidatus Woesebacteria bacterium]